MTGKKNREPRKKKLYVVMDVLCVAVGKLWYKAIRQHDLPFVWVLHLHLTVISKSRRSYLSCQQLACWCVGTWGFV